MYSSNLTKFLKFHKFYVIFQHVSVQNLRICAKFWTNKHETGNTKFMYLSNFYKYFNFHKFYVNFQHVSVQNC